MGVTRFSDEVLAELRKNPYIARVIKGYKIEFTQEFQVIACQQLLKGLKTMREIFQEHGVDPEVLGSCRIANFARKLRNKVKNRCQSEEINVMKRRELRNNPYVLSVVNDRIKFTEEFKDLVCQELLKGEKSVHEIFEYFGFDTRLLGESRIWSFASKLRKRCVGLSEKQRGATNIQADYTTSQKEREDIINCMRTNGSHHEKCIELPNRQQMPGAEDFEADVEANKGTTTLQKFFTEDERRTLLNNPYVANVTNCAVQFTEEFKELAYQEFVQTRKTMREILQEHAIDPEILGTKRIWNFTSRLQEKAKKLQGFGDARAHNRRRPKYNPTEEKTLAERIRVLEHELAYTRQEVDFLKKNQMADMEARILWESKHRPK